ncbi:MAG: peptidyl-prolyl cis-trans isomerase [Novosphingobium sp.]
MSNLFSRSALSKSAGVCLCAGAALLVSGCNKTPGGQVVAVMNNQEITRLELQSEAQQENLPANLDPRAISPMLLQRIIDRNIMADLAREQGLDRSPQYVTRRRQMEQSLLAELALRKLTGNMRDPSPAEIKTYIDSNPILFANREHLKLDIVHFTKPLARQKVLQLTALPSIDQIAQQLRQLNVGAQRLTTVLDTGTIDANIAKQIAALAPGTIFDMSAGGMTFIGTVIARENASVPHNLWPKIAANSINNERALKTVGTTLNDLRSRAKIIYAPEYRPPDTK